MSADAYSSEFIIHFNHMSPGVFQCQVNTLAAVMHRTCVCCVPHEVTLFLYTDMSCPHSVILRVCQPSVQKLIILHIASVFLFRLHYINDV